MLDAAPIACLPCLECLPAALNHALAPPERMLNLPGFPPVLLVQASANMAAGSSASGGPDVEAVLESLSALTRAPDAQLRAAACTALTNIRLQARWPYNRLPCSPQPYRTAC